MDLNDDVMLEIVSHLDAISIFRFVRTCKRLWNQYKTKEDIHNRVIPYQKYIKYEQWNKGLTEAVKRNHFPQVVFFAEQQSVDLEYGLAMACETGNIPMLSYFIIYDWKKVIFASAQGGQKELVEFLCEKDKSEEAITEAIVGAAKGGHIDLVRLFLDRYKMLTTEKLNHHAVAAAAHGGYKEIVELLMPHTRESAAMFGLPNACLGAHKELTLLFWEKLKKEGLTFLLDFRATEAFECANKSGNKEFVLWIQDVIEFYDWETGLRGAVQGGNFELVEFCLEKYLEEDPSEEQLQHKWDIELVTAAEYGHIDLVKYFIEKGADTITDAMYMAVMGDHREIVELLIEEGFTNWDQGFLRACMGGHIGLAKFFFNKGLEKPDEVVERIMSSSSRKSIKTMLDCGITVSPEWLRKLKKDKPELAELVLKRQKTS